MDAPSMDEFRERLADAGWQETRAYERYGFGSWLLEFGVDVRVACNGKDGWLEVYRATSPDNWKTVWTAVRRVDQTPAALLNALGKSKSAHQG